MFTLLIVILYYIEDIYIITNIYSIKFERLFLCYKTTTFLENFLQIILCKVITLPQ